MEPSSSTPSIVMEWSGPTVRVGYIHKGRPQHVFRLPNEMSTKTSPSRFYSLVSPLVIQMWDLLVVSPSANPRIFILCADSFPSTIQREALSRAIFDMNVSGITFVNALDTLPYAMGWKRGLIVKIDNDDATVAAHVDGRCLPETFQVVPNRREQQNTKAAETKQQESSAETETKDEKDVTSPVQTSTSSRLLDERHPLSVVFAVLKSLELCPRDVRNDVASNICIVGDDVPPNFGRKLGKRLTTLLKEESSTPATSPESTPEEQLEEPALAPELTAVLPTFKALKGLEVSIMTTTPHRPDVVCWVGSSIWASALNLKHTHSSRIKWNRTGRSNLIC
mmetsp:Transcript_28099/g.39509  ORF Transcript_28099/g.39509 Transcript_28099/m.39509 type:complete len:337 (-) Transcript_28099:108-1118(-)